MAFLADPRRMEEPADCNECGDYRSYPKRTGRKQKQSNDCGAVVARDGRGSWLSIGGKDELGTATTRALKDRLSEVVSGVYKLSDNGRALP